MFSVSDRKTRFQEGGRERERGLAEKYGFNDDDVVTYKTRLFQYSLAVLRMQLRLPSPYQVGYTNVFSR